MNNVVVIFLDSMDKFNAVTECEVVSTTTLVTVFPLAIPANKSYCLIFHRLSATRCGKWSFSFRYFMMENTGASQ